MYDVGCVIFVYYIGIVIYVSIFMQYNLHSATV